MATPDNEAIGEIEDLIDAQEYDDLSNDGRDQDGDATVDHEASDDDADSASDVDTVTFGDDAETPANESSAFKQLRQRARELERQNRELRRAQKPEAAIVVGDRPTLAAFDYDEDAYQAELDKWYERKSAAEKQTQEAAQVEDRRKQEWADVQRKYVEEKSRLTFADAQEAEDEAFGALNEVQQAVIGRYAKNPALLVYALGKNPAKLQALASESDPIRMGQMIQTLEASMKTQKRIAPEPDTPVRGRPVNIGTVDKVEQRLEAEADRTGDRTALLEYRRKRREAA